MATGGATDTLGRPLAPDPDVPRLATDVELIGRFEDSGFKEPPYIVRRRDGQVVQLAPVLYALAEEVDGRRDTTQIAEALSHRIRRGVDAGMVEMLLEGQLRRLGIVAERNGITAEVEKVDPLLALRFRVRVVPARVVRAVTTLFRPLFWPPVMVAVLAGLMAIDAWLFGVHGISQGLRHVLYQPALLFMLLGGVIVATAFHEIGHATALRYGGGEPGVMGVGVYIVWPAFYTDITDAYRLGKGGRLRADTGGMYFNAVFALVATAAYFATGFEPVLLLVVLQNFAIAQQSLPFLRLDGYYIVSDLTGVPDMLSRIRPVLASLLPWRRADDRVTELKPWVRVVVTAYVIALVPVLAVVFVLMLVHAPRAFATAWDSLAVRWDRVANESAAGAVKDVFQMAVLVLPCFGMTYTTGRVGRRAWRGAWRWSGSHPLWRGPVLVAAATAVATVGFLWWPRGDYRPIQPGERGTLVGGLRSLPDVPGGRASLTPQRQIQLRGAPTERERARARAPGGASTPPAAARDQGAATTTTGTGTATTDAPTTATGTATTGSPPSSAPVEPWASPPTSDPATSWSSPPTSDPGASWSSPPPTSAPPAGTTPSDTTTTDTTSTTETTPTQTTPTETTPTQTTTTDTTPTQTTTTDTTTTPPPGG